MTFQKFLNYSLTLFFPLLLPALVLIPGVTLALLGSSDLSFLLVLLTITVLPVTFISALFYLCRRFSSFRQRFLVNYVGWIILGGGVLYSCASAIGGSSMAVVEGAVDQRQFRTVAFYGAIEILLYAQIMIIPLCLWATRRTTTLFAPTQNRTEYEA